MTDDKCPPGPGGRPLQFVIYPHWLFVIDHFEFEAGLEALRPGINDSCFAIDDSRIQATSIVNQGDG
ncbi:MAG: hypothetical protein DMG08_14795 [Acidobacteria bacterium]|nr:MAG: hypothetical protein DMG08_14795 [Acidobacteriota bacterium]